MAGSSDLEVLKDIPGYKAILKSVLKSQIQLLIEQLSDHTGEETIILTASVHDGTLTHLGSNTGKGFLDGRDEIKSQFLAFCLKSHHRKKSTEARSSPYQRPLSGDRLTPSPVLSSHKRPRLQPVSLQRAGVGDGSGSSFTPPDIHRAPSQSFSTNGQDNSSSINVKLETNEQSGSSTDSTNFAAASVSFPTSLQLSHTQTSAEQGTSDTSETQNDDDFTEQTSENDDSTATSIKIEPITENEMELEITGVEPGKTSVSADTWGQGQVPGTSVLGDGASDETGNQSGYRGSTFPLTVSSANEPHLPKENMIKKKVTFSCEMPALRIPKRLYTESLFDQGNELLEREFRNPLNEVPVTVKSEPVDQEVLGESTDTHRKFWPGMQTSNHMFALKSKCQEERTMESISQRKNCDEIQRQNDVFRWKPLKQTGQEGTNRSGEHAASSDKQEAKRYGEQRQDALTNKVVIPKNGEHESEWKRTVIVGRPKKHTDKQRRVIREYVDDVLAHIRSEAERPNNRMNATVDGKVENQLRQVSEVCEDRKHINEETVDNASLEEAHTHPQNFDLCLKMKRKKKKHKHAKKKKKELDSGSEVKLKSQIGAVLSPKVDTNMDLTETYQHAPVNAFRKVVKLKHHCKYCPMAYASEIALRRHMWRHTKVKPFLCRHCPLGFMKMKKLSQHMFREHPGLQN